MPNPTDNPIARDLQSLAAIPPAPRQPTTAETAVGLLRGLAAKEPYGMAGDCHWCGAWSFDPHKPDCEYQTAKAFLDGLPKEEA